MSSDLIPVVGERRSQATVSVGHNNGGVKFDATISLGHLISTAIFIVMLMTMYTNLVTKIENVQTKVDLMWQNFSVNLKTQ